MLYKLYLLRLVSGVGLNWNLFGSGTMYNDLNFIYFVLNDCIKSMLFGYCNLYQILFL